MVLHDQKIIDIEPTCEILLQRERDLKNEITMVEPNSVNIHEKKVEPEWKQDEEEILKGDRYTSFSYGGGRFGNQIIRNLAMSLIAEKFDLIMRYQRSDEIEKLGLTLFSGKKKYNNIKAKIRMYFRIVLSTVENLVPLGSLLNSELKSSITKALLPTDL